MFTQEDNQRAEPKFIIFLTQLLSLFRFCHTCTMPNPLVEASQTGTLVVVKPVCNNPNCPKKESVRYSQPMISGTSIPAGNFLLSMAILVAGGSASKVLRIFSHMGLAGISLNTYFRHQRVCADNTFSFTLFKDYSNIKG